MNECLNTQERDFLLMRSSEGYIRIENNHITLVNNSLLRILGYHHQKELPALFPELVYDHREFVKYSAALIGNCDVSHYDLSLRGSHGEKVTVRCEAKSLLETDGVVVFLLLEDITIQHKRLEELMLKSTVFEHNPFSVAITDASGVIDVINRRFRKRTGFTDETLRGANIFEQKAMISPLTGLNVADMLNEIERRPEFVGEFESKTRDGEIFQEELHIVPVYSQGVLRNILFIGYDVTEERVIKQRLEDMAYHDQMTGLLRKEAFFEVGKELKASTDEEQKNLGLFFIDLDNFKPVNDRYGHRVGDMVLIQCATMLRNLFRHTDVVARYGGDEFVAICPDVASIENMRVICEKIVGAINSSPLELTGQEISITISVGACFYSGDKESGLSFDDLINKADKHMYQAKRRDVEESYLLDSV